MFPQRSGGVAKSPLGEQSDGQDCSQTGLGARRGAVSLHKLFDGLCGQVIGDEVSVVLPFHK